MVERSRFGDKLRDAVKMHQAGNLAAAERLYRDILEREPTNAEARNLLGVLAMQRGKPDQAAFQLATALKLNPASPSILTNYAMALRQLKQPARALECYDKALLLKPDDARILSNRGLVLVDLRRLDEALASYDRAIALMPDDFAALFNRGRVLAEMKRTREALDSYDRALAIKPDDVKALSNRGLVLAELRRHAEALTCLDRALALAPDNPDILSNRGAALLGLDRFEDALNDFDRALRGNADDVGALAGRGWALSELGRLDAALTSYRRAIALDPEHVVARWNDAITRLQHGDFVAGWAGYEVRWRTAPFAGWRRDFPRPLWLGDADIVGRTILLHAEQGLGDTIQFCRYVGAVIARGARVLLEAHAPLLSLLGRMNREVAVFPRHGALPEFDVHCPLLSLPHALGTRLETIPADVPYLAARADFVAAWRDTLRSSPAPRIGIAWSGNASHPNDHHRSMTLATFAPILAADCTFICLQKEIRPVDAPTLAAHPDILLAGGDLHDFEDTAALIATVDLVVSIDTSVAHLAGALGKPVWLLLPFRPDFRWLLGRDDSPWYPTMRLYRQPAPGDWDSVIARARDDLAAMAAHARDDGRD